MPFYGQLKKESYNRLEFYLLNSTLVSSTDILVDPEQVHNFLLEYFKCLDKITYPNLEVLYTDIGSLYDPLCKIAGADSGVHICFRDLVSIRRAIQKCLELSSMNAKFYLSLK